MMNSTVSVTVLVVECFLDCEVQSLQRCRLLFPSIAGPLSCRDNLDPFSQHQDVDLWEALRSCHVAGAVRGLGGLEAVVGEVGGSLSAGQLQLLCLARVLLRKPKVRQGNPCTVLYCNFCTVGDAVLPFLHVFGFKYAAASFISCHVAGFRCFRV